MDRREVLAAGAALSITVGLAACSSPERRRPEKQLGPGSVPAADVPVGGGIVLGDVNFVVTQPTDGDYRAFVKICPHKGCPVSRVDAEGIFCPCHGSRFDIETGKALNGPATAPLSKATVTLEGDTLKVEG